MGDEPQTQSANWTAKKVSLKIFGVGGAGLNILEQVAGCNLPNATLVAVNTDAESLQASSAAEKFCVESKLTRGMGTGGDPERGRAAAEQHLASMKAACEGVDLIFILAGLGGGAGTGISPLLAHVAKEAGALVLAFVTMPFECEGNRRQRQAQHGLQELKATADGVICLPSQKLFKLIDENTSVIETFKLSNELLAQGVTSVWRLVVCKGMIEIHFSDLCAFLRDRHNESYFATAEASGSGRSREVVDRLLAHPMLDGGKTLSESDAVMVSLIGGNDLTMSEVNRVMEHINSKCAKAQVVMGAAMDPQSQERLAVTIVATRRGEPLMANPGLSANISASDPAGVDELLDTQLHLAPEAKRPSRFVPPPPSLSAERLEQLAGGRGVRPRKPASRMRQGQLPLEIVSKGRFNKSEPTIHKGEDLDVPTYIRRGVALN